MVEKIYEGSKVGEARDNRCGDTEWKAASNSARKKRNVDETGLEILGCRHSIAQAAVNMYRGELYGYAHYLQKTFVIPRKVQFLWYDIVGKFWPWVCKHDVAATETVKPALSVIHAKAHSWKCQAGMRLLTEHALAWNKRKILRMADVICKRYLNVVKQLSHANKKLSAHLKDIGVSENEIIGWNEEVQKLRVREEQRHKVQGKMSNQEMVFVESVLGKTERSEQEIGLMRHASALYRREFARLKSNPTNKEIQTELIIPGEATLTVNVIRHLKAAMQNAHYSIAQLSLNIAKLADSSKQRSRLRKKISQEKRGLKELVSSYNLLVENHISIEDVEAGLFPWLFEYEERYATDSEKDIVIRGKLSVTQMGIDFALCQLACGTAAFKKFIDVNASSDDDDNVDDDGSDDDLWFEGEDSDDETNDVDVAPVINECSPQSMSDLNKTYIWKYPKQFSQGSIDG
ncbi:predicted protein [Nematostella vectensis]|uniref:Uncharacterized protein n=1 Tax=Nematostella vectensis TaxID=45351 RepID=A7STX4_NEMVE|nr:predicted protein [Nematostella vectensis]|eukprot:XP_001624946.1 predicted protein [Nematostella vectensis]